MPNRNASESLRAAGAILYLVIVLGPVAALAQSRAVAETDVMALQALSARFAENLRRQRPQLYYDLLASQDPAQKALNEDADIRLMRISSSGMPHYYTIHNIVAAATMSTDHVWPGSGFPLAQNGVGTDPGELAIWDAGAVYRFHQEFAGGRVADKDGSAVHYHATHVAGTMIAEGVVPYAKGMSFEATLDSYDWENDEIEMALAAAAGLQISNHSYGWNRGWQMNIYGQWYWWGDLTVNANEDHLFGFYDITSQEWDEIAYAAPYYLIVKSVGNDNGDVGPGPFAEHHHWDPVAEGWRVATDYHQEDNFSGYDTIEQHGVCKNVLTVGAVEDIPGGYTNPGDVIIADFSSWGPADDGRIKPDLVANGIDMISTFPSASAAYDTLSGTSMSTPAVSGSLNLIARLFETRHGKLPRSSTLKALAIAGADEAGTNDGPDYVHGWGLMNTLRSGEIAYANEFDSKGVGEALLPNLDVHAYYFNVPSPRDVRVTIAWTDPAGTPPAPALDPSTPVLVNDLDLRVQRVGSTQYLPWKLNRLLPAFPAAQADNTVDNVEQVDIANAPAGTYVVRVSHKGTLAAPQAYSMAWQGLDPVQPEAIGLITDGADVELRPLDAAVKQFNSTGNQERGVFVSLTRDFDVQSVGIKLALTCPTDVTASIYHADGMTRGALLASYTIFNAYHPGEVFYYVPLPQALSGCEDYEIVFQFGDVRHWWYWDDSDITLPFQRAGVFNVRGGSGPGGAAVSRLPHVSVVGVAPSPQATADLTPPATAWSTCGDSSTKRGVFVKAEKTVFVHSVTWRASYPIFSDVELRANIYDAVGTTRGSLIASGVFHPGILSSAMQDYVIPVSAVLREGRNYDIEVVFTAGSWECKSEALFALPFTVGAVRVLDGEAGGNSGNSIMPHIKVAWSDGVGGTVIDMAKPADPTTYQTMQSGYDRGVYVTALVDKQVFSLGWLADIPEGETIGARVYEATGITRGALIAVGSITSASAGERWHDIPVSAALAAGQDYDLEIEINGVNSYKYWLENNGMPFSVGGIQVRDSETGGDASNMALAHFRVNACGLIPTGVGDGPTTPPPFALLAPYPNPVAGMARIGFSLDRGEPVTVAVYDVRGRHVKTLLDGVHRHAGIWQLDLPARELSAGVYFVRLSSASRSVSRKIVVVR